MIICLLHILTLSDALQMVIAFNVDHITIVLIIVPYWCHLNLLENLMVVARQHLPSHIFTRLLRSLTMVAAELALVNFAVEVVKGDNDGRDIVAAAPHRARF